MNSSICKEVQYRERGMNLTTSIALLKSTLLMVKMNPSTYYVDHNEIHLILPNPLIFSELSWSCLSFHAMRWLPYNTSYYHPCRNR